MKNKKIITGDWHLRDDKPRCIANNDWDIIQHNTLNFIFDLAKKENADIINTGDTLDKSTVHSYIISMFLEIVLYYPEVDLYMLAGNHELLYHSVLNILKHSFGNIWTIVKSKNNIIHDFAEIGLRKHWNDEFYGDKKSEMAALHMLVYEKSVPDYISKGITAKYLIEKLKEQYKNIKYIFTGDNHDNFVVNHLGVTLINPGCITIQDADKKNYVPVVYLLDTDTGKIEKIKIPTNNILVVDDEYLVGDKDREKRIGAFIESVKNGGDVSLDFLGNLDKAIKKNSKILKSEIIDLIYEFTELLNIKGE